MGWSGSRAITRKSFDNKNDEIRYYGNPDNYRDPQASWFSKTWWEGSPGSRWAAIYYNDTNMPLKLSKMSFIACAGNSGGNYFWASNAHDAGGGNIKSYGGGFNFTSVVYVTDRNKNPIGSYQQGNCVLPSCGTNCIGPNGIGSTYTRKGPPYTSFGNPSVFRGNEALHPVEIQYNVAAAVAVPPGGYLIVNVVPTAWHVPSDSYALIVIKKGEASTTGTFEPENTDYIWVMQPNNTWKKTKKALIMTTGGWKILEEK